jgi:hypothetical protein
LIQVKAASSKARKLAVMRQKSVALAIARPAVSAAGLLGASATLYLSAMTPKWAAEAMFGPICGGHAALALHCPACYAAAALAGLGLGAAALAGIRASARP